MRFKQSKWHLSFKYIIWVIFPLFLNFLVEYLQRETILETWRWIQTKPYTFMVGYGIISLVFIGFYFLTARTWSATLITGSLFLVGALINYFKMELRGDAFVPWDLRLGKELSNIMEHISIEFTPQMMGGILFVSLFFIGTLFLKEKKISWRARLVGLSVSLISFMVGFYTLFMNKTNMNALGIYEINWDQVRNYNYNGFLVGFMVNTKNIIIMEPNGYSKESVENLLNSVNVTSENNVKPNIIMIMNESFWDPTKLEGVTFSEDPLPTINKLRKEAVSGWLLTQQYGGNTANTEFEVLTGDGMMFLPNGAMAYPQYVKEEYPSLASFLKEEGYTTVGIHSYQKWFWNRDEVYPALGFEKFVSDEDFNDPEIRGNYISDEETIKKLIEEYEKAKAESDAPFFGFTVTMENHAPYDDKTYPSRNISASAEGASEEVNLMLDNYVQGVKDADNALKQVIAYFEKVKEPTIVVMFGDHLPMLGNDYKVYKELGYIPEGEWSAEHYLDMYTTPFVAWNNYALKKEDMGVINAHYLAPKVLSSMQVELPRYFDYLLEMSKTIPAYSNYVYVDGEGKAQLEAPEEIKNKKQQHWLLQYDKMFGKKYSKGLLYQK
ncbi:hypothetical protein CS063_03170 [Sporanaerobium hydrogeniformans]|uniref:Uncharacterized protein n=1 Tax=Sporanaerobium hydrogeniformans TaxID=3072179 RepID=A0AC61DEI3_9FIRM|nr:LTA synthase family protein [Sporanaerobium hydrogeniformans]PHV71580.1 hypothetical protein CS063_03170 [Sporanaerobium hydrogeniformans]